MAFPLEGYIIPGLCKTRAETYPVPRQALHRQGKLRPQRTQILPLSPPGCWGSHMPRQGWHRATHA